VPLVRRTPNDRTVSEVREWCAYDAPPARTIDTQRMFVMPMEGSPHALYPSMGPFAGPMLVLHGGI